ncbi:MAG: hypothetical protein AB7G39_14390 [Alphaproteobacteria bacterium]
MSRSFRSAAILLALGTLAGCAAQWPIQETVPPGDERILYSGIEAAQATRVKHVDNFEREEYARFAAKDAQAEFIYSQVTASEVSLHFDYSMQAAAETWAFNRGKPKTWGEEGDVVAPRAGLVWYRPYTLTAENRSCVAFKGEWDDPPGDPNHWPGKILFGYHCTAPGQTLSTAQIEGMAAGIGLVGREARTGLIDTIAIDRSAGLGVNSVARTDAAAMRAATGADAGGRYGNPRYPFNFAYKFNVQDGWRP